MPGFRSSIRSLLFSPSLIASLSFLLSHLSLVFLSLFSGRIRERRSFFAFQKETRFSEINAYPYNLNNPIRHLNSSLEHDRL